jgi:hypothetical protein
MMQVTHVVSVPGLGSEYEKFLFAPITADENGTLLSVISALARLGLDPWQEAARLARMSGDGATQRLASLIAAMPERPTVIGESGMVAARLIALLPQRAVSSIPSGHARRVFGAMTNSQRVVYAILIVTALLLGAIWFAATRPSTVPTDFTQTSALSTTSTSSQIS